MTINDKLKAEDNNYNSIILYGDKSKFVHAYERSAFAFTKLIRKYKVSVQTRKDAPSYCHIGFPASSMKEFLPIYKFTSSSPEEGVTVYTANINHETFTEQEFQTWKRVSEIEYIKKKGSVTSSDKTDTKEKNNPKISGKSNIPVSSKSQAPDSQEQSVIDIQRCTESKILDDILMQQLSEYTPMMALTYLNDLQRRIKDARKRA